MFDIVTIGDCTNDIFIKPTDDHFSRGQIGITGSKLYIRHGDKISVDEMHDEIGGGAANVAVGLSQLGLKTAVMSIIGADDTAEKIKKRFLTKKVSQDYLKIDPRVQTNTSVVVVYRKERTIFVYRGKKDYSLIKIPKNLKTKWIYLAPTPKEFASHYAKLIALVSEKNVNLAINPGHRQILQVRTELMKLLKVTKVLVVNKEEAIDLTNSPRFADMKHLLLQLTTYGPQIAIITDGANGAFVTDGKQYLGSPIYPVEVIDPTGAGDAFSSGFLANFVINENLDKSLICGVLNSSAVLNKYGAQANLQNRSQIEKILKYAPKLYKL